MEFNRLTFKVLLMSVITECKFKQPLTPNAKFAKADFKQAFGLKKSATNSEVLKAIGITYEENGLKADFDGVIQRFKAEKYLV